MDVNRVAWIKADDGLFKTFNVIEVRMTAEYVEVSFALFAPLGLQVPGAIAEAAAAVQNDVVSVGSFNGRAYGLWYWSLYWMCSRD